MGDEEGLFWYYLHDMRSDSNHGEADLLARFFVLFRVDIYI